MAAVLQGQTRPRGLSAVRGRRRAGQVEESQLSSRVIAEVREQVRRRGLDPFDAPTEVASIVDAVLNEHDQISARTGSASFEDLEEVRHRILDAVAGFGVLQPLLAGENISSAFVVPTVAACFDLVVHCRRRPDGHREVEEILAVGTRVENGIIETSTLFHRVGGDLVAAGAEVPAPGKFALAGISTEQVRECLGRSRDDGSGR